MARLLSLPVPRLWLSGAFLAFYLWPGFIGWNIMLRQLAISVPNHFLPTRFHTAHHDTMFGSEAPPIVTFKNLPCDRQMFTPTVWFPAGDTYRLNCVDVGYKRAMVDIYSAQGVQDVIGEMKRRPGVPVLLYNTTFQSQFPDPETDMSILPGLEGVPLYMPKARHEPVHFSSVGDYIKAHYHPGQTLEDGYLRVWEPN